ncbi:MAG: phosphoribosylamine--glycine ligase [Synergistaceae bacterium]|nr:phosphoribosylamine--glycine ligase [Synergistaceae bacterium]
MDVMIVGGGGREHAIASRLARSPHIDRLYALPGNGGIADVAELVSIAADDIDGVITFARERSIGFAVVPSETPLALGIVERLEAAGTRCFGPSSKAALIESSKSYAKDLMTAHGIPTARYEFFSDMKDALGYVSASDGPLVVKADGLTAGKGAVVAEDSAQARAAVIACMKAKVFGKSGERIVVEERLTGPEVTVLAFTDGKTIVPMVSSMDHKRAYDGDRGPNTGGMGAIAPNPFYGPAMAEECMERIFLPTIRALEQDGRAFKGCLYFGLMLTPDGPKVIEYNCRFGDPEAQAVLPLLESDLFEIMLAVDEERLAEADVRFSSKASCCVVVASREYPAPGRMGLRIDLGGADQMEGVEIFHSGTRREGGELLTAGGRVLAVTAVAGDAAAAREQAYEAAGRIRFEGARYRKDIGAHVL